MLLNKYFVIVGMTIVTYLPRLMPFYVGHLLKKNGFLRRLMKLIPYTALVALILPGVFKATDALETAVIGLITAMILAYYKCHVVLVILGAIVSVFLFQLFF